ncbi:terminase large subunit [Methylobrevis albus]|uniref:Terminase large subunit n=1 Tax=Methylobrevis albus TaxID=2793297 RepID=A0A931I5C6_9HYPH|nr:terminase TerL endonuclease subunit [Methylobrevis albus]MBH0239121.1 terminase large subunit [Methylobrevis albus]
MPSTSDVRPAWVFDESPIADPDGRGQRAVDFLRLLRHPKSRLPRQQFQLDPPFERIVRRIYGPTDDRGQRQVRTVYLQVGRGSRKTSLAAGLALLHTFGPERIPRGENLIAASDRKQARIGFEEATSIVETTPQLAAAARVIDSRNRFLHPKSGSRFEAISCDAPSQHGRTPSLVIVDELHAHRKADLWQALRTGAAKTSGSLIIIATTAGRGNESPDYPLLEYAKQVQAGEIEDETFLPIIFEAPADADWQDEALWHRLLPGLEYGYPDLPSLRQLAREARERPSDRAAFCQYYLGIRQQNSLSPFIDMAIFDAGKRDIDIDQLAHLPCWIGLDSSSTTDLTAVVAVFADGADLYVKTWAFIPADAVAKRSDRDKVPYIDWSRDEWVIATDGNVIDYAAVAAHIEDLCQRFDVQEIVADAAYAMPILQPLMEAGRPVLTMRQGWFTQSPALSTLERAIISGRLYWDSPALRWCVENVAIHTDSAGNRVMHKGRSRDRIDLAVALWMAVSRASQGAAVSVLDDADFDPARFVVTI